MENVDELDDEPAASPTLSPSKWHVEDELGNSVTEEIT